MHPLLADGSGIVVGAGQRVLIKHEDERLRSSIRYKSVMPLYYAQHSRYPRKHWNHAHARA